MTPAPPPADPERLRRILEEVHDRMRRGERPDPAWYYLRYPELEGDLRGHFRRLGLLIDPFGNSDQYLREKPPWEPRGRERGAPPRGAELYAEADARSSSRPGPRSPSSGAFASDSAASESPIARSAGGDPGGGEPATERERDVPLHRLMRPAPRPVLHRFPWRRVVAVLLLALAFLAGWLGLRLRDQLAGPREPGPAAAGFLDGPAALLVLGLERPDAKEDFFLEGLRELDRAPAGDRSRSEVRWVRYLLLQGLARTSEARWELQSLPSAPKGALAALGALAVSDPERAARIMGDAPSGSGPSGSAPSGNGPSGKGRRDGALADIVRGAALPAERAAAAKQLLAATDPHARLLGAAWGVRAGIAGARQSLRALPLDDLPAAIVLVELGEEEDFLAKARPGRIDLAPLRLELLERRGRRAEALRQADEFLAASPDSFRLRLLAAKLARGERQWEVSLAHLRAATLLSPESGDPMREWFRLALDCPERPDLISTCAELFLRRTVEEARRTLAAEAGDGQRRDAADPAGAGPERLLNPCGFGAPREPALRSAAVTLLRDLVDRTAPLDRGAGGRAAPARGTGPASHRFLLGRVLFADGRWEEAAESFSIAVQCAELDDRPALRAWLVASLRRAGREWEAGAEETVHAAAREEASPVLTPAIEKLDGADGKDVERFLERTLSTRPDLEEAAVRLARLLTADGAPGGDPRKAAEILAGRVDLNRSSPAILREYASALEWAGDWTRAAAVLTALAARQGAPSVALRARAAWANVHAGALEDAGALLAGGDGGADAAILRAFLAARQDDLSLAETWLGAAVRREPLDPRPWFLRGYFRRLDGRDAEADRDWNELLALSAGGGAAMGGSKPPPDGKGTGGRGPHSGNGTDGNGTDGTGTGSGTGTGDAGALELEALPWLLAIVHASRGDPSLASAYSAMGPRTGRTLPGSFLRAAALAAGGQWEAAEGEAMAYRARGFPLEPWQARDPWVGPLFTPPTSGKTGR